jgi:hypothetical protein
MSFLVCVSIRTEELYFHPADIREILRRGFLVKIYRHFSDLFKTGQELGTHYTHT